MGQSKTTEKSIAKKLFLNWEGTPDVKEIAKRATVSVKTLRGWINKENWEDQRKSVFVTRPKIIRDYYNQLERLNNHINDRPIVYDVPDALLKGTKLKNAKGIEYVEYPNYNPKDYPILIGNFATSKETSQITSLTNAIKKLETEVSIAEAFEVASDVLDSLKADNFELFKQMIPVFDDYINKKAAQL